MRWLVWLPVLMLAQPGPLGFDANRIADRIVSCGESPSERLLPAVGIPPGAPPAFAFRVFDAGDRGRLADIGLMTDDAGH